MDGRARMPCSPALTRTRTRTLTLTLTLALTLALALTLPLPLTLTLKVRLSQPCSSTHLDDLTLSQSPLPGGCWHCGRGHGRA